MARKPRSQTVVDLEGRRYEGASKSKRTSGWIAPHTDADTAIGHDSTLKDRSRDLVRNNPHAAKIVSVLTTSTVGYGIRIAINSSSKGRTKAVTGMFAEWSHDPMQCDAGGRLDLYGIQSQVMRTVFESGECLIRLRPRNQKFPLALQVLEPDYIADLGQWERLPNGGELRDGIEFDADGRRTAYRIWRDHPGSQSLSFNYEWFRVPAEEILHIYRAERPGQSRGVPVLAPVIIRLRELDIFQDAFLKRQQIANLFAAFISPDAPSALAGDTEDIDIDFVPGAIIGLPTGCTITFSDPPDASGYAEFCKPNLRDIATGVGLSYEAITGDYSDSNFSTSRMGAMLQAATIETWQWQVAVPQLCKPIFQWFREALMLIGFDAADAYADWTPPAIVTISDPVKQYDALAAAVRGGFISWPEAVRELGYSPESQLQEIADFQKRVVELGIELDWGSKTPAATAPDSTAPTPGAPTNG